MQNFYQQLGQQLAWQSVVVATVTQVRGSAPREVGAKMLIGADGSMAGTIGGGAGEAKVIQQAQNVLNTGKAQWVEIDLSGVAQRETEGVCGGWMQVWLARWAGEAAIDLVHDILTVLQSGQTATLVTPFQSGCLPYLDWEWSLAEPQGTEVAFQEPLRSSPTLLILGAGHVGVVLAQVASLAGFQVAVQDDRPDFANTHRFPQADWIFADAIAPALTALENVSQLHIALVSRGYQLDLAGLKILYGQARSYDYIGMIGSRKRVQMVYRELIEQGIPEAWLRSLHAPIGLNIGAVTPAEIAISICAEMIQVRRRGMEQAPPGLGWE